MRKTKNITWRDKDITVKELTMQELIDILDEPPASDELSIVTGLGIESDLPLEAVIDSAGVTKDELCACTPSQVEALWQAVEEVNPFFLRAAKRLSEQRQQITAPPAS